MTCIFGRVLISPSCQLLESPKPHRLFFQTDKFKTYFMTASFNVNNFGQFNIFPGISLL